MSQALLLSRPQKQAIHVWKKYNAVSTTTYTWNRWNAVTTTTYKWNKYNAVSTTTYTWNKWSTVEGAVEKETTQTYAEQIDVSNSSFTGRYYDLKPYVVKSAGTFKTTSGRYYMKYTNYTVSRFGATIPDAEWEEVELTPALPSNVGLRYNMTNMTEWDGTNHVPVCYKIYYGTMYIFAAPAQGTYMDYGVRIRPSKVVEAVAGTIKGPTSYGTVSSTNSSAYPNGGASGDYWYDGRTSSTSYSQGSTSYGQVTSTSSSAYPSNGRSGSYWYVSAGSTTTTSKGSTKYSDVSSTNSSAYPNGGASGSYWYDNRTSSTSWSMGSYLEDVISLDPKMYPTNGRSGSYWYVYQGIS